LLVKGYAGGSGGEVQIVPKLRVRAPKMMVLRRQNACGRRYWPLVMRTRSFPARERSFTQDDGIIGIPPPPQYTDGL
jgi:hypothetical protein